ncbi:alpha/beta hydrolase [Mesorhizobium sp. VNQ89]|uniref:alpha/beta hydrolase n=1 Tax=Mesorhizobium quangtriensis TaxID=3157709 RepID=UPI0032B81266
MTEIFHEIPSNPTPEKATGGFFTGFDGRKLRYGRFPAVARPLKGTVILLSGRNECIEKYFETARNLAERGFTTATFDWRGQGGSERLLRDPQRGHVRSFSDYVKDLDRFFEEVVLPDCRGPYYVLAHSTGALIALLATPSLVNRVQRMVLAAPFLTYTGFRLSRGTIGRLAGILYWMGLGRMYGAMGPRPRRSPPFATNKVTTDIGRYRRNMEIYETYPALALGGPTVSWIRAACRAVDIVENPEFMQRINIPILFVGAGNDEIVSTRAIADYARRLRGGSILTIAGARHELLQEADIFREQLLAAFDAFVPGNDVSVYSD